jgi:hypothetical protein
MKECECSIAETNCCAYGPLSSRTMAVGASPPVRANKRKRSRKLIGIIILPNRKVFSVKEILISFSAIDEITLRFCLRLIAFVIVVFAFISFSSRPFFLPSLC